MNWSDLIVLAIIAGFAIVGMVNGFLLSIFRLVSYFVSIFLAIKLYPVVSSLLMKTALYTNIQESIFKSLMKQQENPEVKQAVADKVVENLNLPGFLKNFVTDKIVNQTKTVDVLSTIIHKVSEVLAGVVIDVISLVALYILIRIGLIFVKILLKGISKIPVFKQVDKFGGFALGALEGLLSTYILFAVITLFRTNPQLEGFFNAVEKSMIANFFYQNNFIIQWMFPT